jgi:hypothetical protein
MEERFVQIKERGTFRVADLLARLRRAQQSGAGLGQ